MPATFEDAFERVKHLAADFKANEKFYLSPAYQEAEARRDFIDKFLLALGWDVNHDTQKNPYEQEVKVERKEHGVSQRRADYAFYLAPNFRDVKFYIEAKKPFGDIATPDNYFQTIRYGWNSQTPIAALFDFEQFEIVDCRFKPDLATALQRNLKKFHFSQYSDEKVFAEIYWLFSREAVANGSLEKYAESLPKKRGAVQRGLLKGGYQSIDEAFLEELDAHRDTLARIFKNHNPTLDGEALTEATQRTLDRLVFIRFLEDKLIEPQYLVAKFGERGSAWGDFIATSRRLDGIYNGIVFKKNDLLDAPTFKVDDDQFGEICEALCHINSAYDFNAIPIHILGSIYERFLGKVIVATDKRARVEEKPEVRKAGGVYYTPEYIVRYIVANTVGKLIDGKSPAQIAEMRFADIACGSGSFLLGVYDLLLRYHTKFYNENPGKARKGDVLPREDGLHLSLQKKREILVNNLYGVDIDHQAVEVAQLSLYLKLLQDETPGSTRQYFLDFEQQALLPTLNKNIVCGNSLIGTDVLSGELFEPVAERKLNPMNFEDRFPEIMKRGGFDAIVGNPPYVMVEDGLEKKYLQQHFETDEGKPDLYKYFIERAHKLLSSIGRFGMIIPASMLMTPAYKRCREFLLKKSSPLTVVSFQGQVFESAQVNSIILVTKNRSGGGDVNWIEDAAPHPTAKSLLDAELTPITVPISAWKTANGFAFIRPQTAQAAWVDKMKQRSQPLGSFGKYVLGMQIYHNSLHSKLEMENRIYHSASNRGKEWIPESGGKNIRRYEFVSEFKEWAKYGDHCYHKPPPEFLSGARIVVREITGKTLICAYTEEKHAPNKAVIIFRSEKTDLKFILGILNSRLIGCYVEATTEKGKQRLFPRISLRSFRELPIPQLDLKNPADKSRHDKLVSLVEQMLAAQPQLARAQSDKDQDFYAHKCAALDRQIDALVYELYALTPDEIKIVEGA